MSLNPPRRRAFRDREFDSLIFDSPRCIAPQTTQSAYAAERAESSVTSEALRALQASPFAHAATEVINANSALFSSLSSGDFTSAKAAHQTAVDTLLAPYYTSRGGFDHKRFLDNLETTKGAPLNDWDLQAFGRLVGIWTGEKLAQEVNDEIEAAGPDASIPVITDIIERGLADALKLN